MLQRIIIIIGGSCVASAVDYVDAGLAKMAKKVDALVAAQEVKKQLNNDDAWTGCGSDGGPTLGIMGSL